MNCSLFSPNRMRLPRFVTEGGRLSVVDALLLRPLHPHPEVPHGMVG